MAGSDPPGPAPGRPAPRRRLVAAAVAGVVLLVAAAALWALGSGSGSAPGATRTAGSGPARVGEPAPAVEGRTLDGATVRLHDFRGRPVVLNFWASWCFPCREELPMLTRAAADHRDRGLVVLGVLLRDLPRDARRFARAHGVTWPTVTDPGGYIAERYRVRSAPATLVIDEGGRIRSRFLGAVTRAQLEEALRELDRDGHSSQRNRRAASSGAATVQTPSTTTADTDQPVPGSSAERSDVDSAAAGSNVARDSNARGRRSSG